MCINVERDDGRFFTGWISSHGPKWYCNLRCSFRHKTHIIKMHFNSPLWRLELFSTPKGYSVKYTNRQFPPPFSDRWVHRDGGSGTAPEPAPPGGHGPAGERGPFATSLKAPLAPDLSPSLGEGTLGENPAQTWCSASPVSKARQSLPGHPPEGCPQPALHSTFSKTRPRATAPQVILRMGIMDPSLTGEQLEMEELLCLFLSTPNPRISARSDNTILSSR